MSSDGDYWAARRDELLRQMEADETSLNEKLAKVYARQAAELEREIAAYYQRYGEGNVIEYRRLLQSLSEEDRRLLIERMDEFAEKYPQHAHLMPVRESIYRLNELEGIQASIRMPQLEIGAVEQAELEEHFRRQAQRAANLAAEQMGFGSSFYSINSQIVVETVGAAWASGKTFSETIWGNRERLAAYLNDDFAQLIARGASYDKVAKDLSSRFENVSMRDIRRLVFTEGTFLFNEAQAQVHESEYELYTLSCADSRACQVCKDIQAAQRANPVRFDERSPGVNFPPLHPNCRCSYIVEVGDWDAWIDAYVSARGGDAVTHAEGLLTGARQREPDVSALLRSLERGGTRLAGFDFRLKGSASLARKIRADAAMAGATEESASGLIHDVLRYTFTADTGDFSDEFKRIRAALEAAGYNMVKVKNTLQFERQAYRGVNTQVSTPDGYVFELQFHTPESLEVKESLNHPLYERARRQETGDDERNDLKRQMVENSAAIPTPPGIKGVAL